MLQPWKSDSITSHGVPVTHCEQATILVLKLKVVQLRKFSFPPNIFFFFSSLLLESRMNLLSYEEFYFPECALLHTEFSKEYASWTQCIQLMEFINMICTLRIPITSSSLDNRHENHLHNSSKMCGLMSMDNCFAMLRRISCTPFDVEMFQDIRCWGITKWK